MGYGPFVLHWLCVRGIKTTPICYEDMHGHAPPGLRANERRQQSNKVKCATAQGKVRNDVQGKVRSDAEGKRKCAAMPKERKCAKILKAKCAKVLKAKGAKMPKEKCAKMRVRKGCASTPT